MRIKFYLKRPNEKLPTAIICSIAFSQNRLKIYTGISVDPRYWNSKTHNARQTSSFRQGSSINTRLDKIRGTIERVYYDYLNVNNAEPSPIVFHRLIDASLGRSKEAKLSFFEYFQDFIDRTRAGQRQTAKGKIISPEKAKMYGTTYNKLKEFNPKLDFENIDLDFYHEFTAWLRKRGFSENTIGGHFKYIKSVLNEATERGQNTNIAFRSKRFTVITEDVDNIALTDSELTDLYNFDLSDDKRLERVRDLFLIGAHSGLRFSDFSRLTSDNINNGIIEIRQSKTGNPVAIPVHPVIKSIIEKYDGNLPESISNQKFNDYLKEIAQQVPSLKVSASKTRTQGGMRTTVNYQKWELVSSHTARRSFATNAYLQGIPTVTIMAITGHKTEKSFLKYIKVTPKDHAKIMAGIWAKSNLRIV